MGIIDDKFSTEFIKFIHGRGDRREPGFQFTPGMMVWYDFLTADAPYHDMDDWVLGRGPEHRVVDVDVVGDRVEVTIDVGNEHEEFAVHWGEHLVPYIDTASKVAAINKNDDQHHFILKGGQWWLLTFGDNSSMRASCENEICYFYSQLLLTALKNT